MTFTAKYLERLRTDVGANVTWSDSDLSVESGIMGPQGTELDSFTYG